MNRSSEFMKVPGLTKEARDSLVAALDALSRWREGIEAANRQCLDEVIDKTAIAARSMGCPDDAIRASGGFFRNASIAQMQMIDWVIDGWKEQLNASVSQTTPTIFLNGAQDFNALAPWNIWVQVAQTWQRTWTPGTGGRRH